MKMFSLKSAIISVLSVALAVVFATQAFAMTPNLTLTSSGNGLIQVTVYADPGANVILDYYSGGQLMGAGIIGQTNYSGYFSTTINANSYAIPPGAQTLVMVNGQQSIPVTWPSNGYNYNNGCTYNCSQVYNSNNQVTLSVSNLNLSIGQTQTITINNNNLYNYNNYPNGGQYYVSNTGNNTIVTATISGSTLTLYGQSVGSTTLSVCSNNTGNYGYSSYNSGCATLYVTVSGTSYNYNYPYNYNTSTYPTTYQYNTYPYNYNYGYNNTPLSVSNNNVQVTVGNSGVVTLYDNNTSSVYPYNTTGYNNYTYGSNYYITNTTSGVANATVNGNMLTIYGTAVGTTSVNVCSTAGNQCATVNVTVIAPVNNYYTNYNGPYNYPTQSGNWTYSYPDQCWHRQN